MQIFELSWSDYDCVVSYLFSHENKTIENFESDVKMLFKKYGNEYIAQETGWVGAPGWVELVAKKLSEFGYILIKPLCVNICGAYIIECKNKQVDSDDFNFGKEFIGERLLKKAVEHNKKLRKKLKNEIHKKTK
jgi:hypothetical protein